MAANRQAEAKPSRRAQRRAAAQIDTEGVEVAEGNNAEAADAAGDDDDKGGGDEPDNRAQRRAAAAKKRRERMRERQAAAAVGLSAEEMVDDAMARAVDTTFKWFRRNVNIIQWVVVLGIVGWASYLIYAWRSTKTQGKASAELATALEAEVAPISDNESPPGAPEAFKTEEARQKAALEGYRQAADSSQAKGLKLYAKLGEAGVLYEQGKYDEAKTKFQELHDAANADGELKGRALEGIALVHEAKGELDKAIDSYKRLQNTDLKGFKELGAYQEARLLVKQDKSKDAIEVLEKLLESIKKDTAFAPGSYLNNAAASLLTLLDPNSELLKPEAPANMEELQRMIQEQMKKAGTGSAAPMPVQMPALPPTDVEPSPADEPPADAPEAEKPKSPLKPPTGAAPTKPPAAPKAPAPQKAPAPKPAPKPPAQPAPTPPQQAEPPAAAPPAPKAPVPEAPEAPKAPAAPAPPAPTPEAPANP